MQRRMLAAQAALAVLFAVGAPSCGEETQSQGAALSTQGDAGATQAYIDATFYTDADIQYSFMTAAGEKIDCIDFYAQRSVRGLISAGASMDYTRVPVPPIPPTSIPKPYKPAGASVAFDGVLDADGHARRCPPGTVPAMRPTVEAIAAAGGLDAYRTTRHPRPMVDPNQDALQHDCYHQFSPGQGWDHAAGLQVPSLTYYGALTIVSVYQPFVRDLVGEHSLSEIWVQTGNCESWTFPYNDPDTCVTGANGDAVQSLEVGWMVGNGYSMDPAAPHLFAFITQDGYQAQNCFAGQNNFGSNCCPFGSSPTGTDCWVAAPGAPYVVNQSLGQYVQPIGSTPAEMSIQVWNGTTHGYPAWFVYIDGQLIGWYPNSAFVGQMQWSATYLQAGGEVFDAWPNGGHTTTQLGSGIFPSVPPPYGNYKYASYHRNVNYIDGSNGYHNASLGFVITPSAELDGGWPGICGYDAGNFGYGLSLSGGLSGWGSYFFFGGNQIF